MSTKDFSSKQEKMIASVLGWKVVAGSGAAACHPGDVISDMWLGECKTHVEKGHKIFFDKRVWEKIKAEAFVKHRFPVLFTDDGTQLSKNTWCLCFKNHVELGETVISSITKGVNKNISFSGESQGLQAMNLHRTSDKLPVFSCRWGDDEVIICQLYVFASVKGE